MDSDALERESQGCRQAVLHQHSHGLGRNAKSFVHVLSQRLERYRICRDGCGDFFGSSLRDAVFPDAPEQLLFRHL